MVGNIVNGIGLFYFHITKQLGINAVGLYSFIHLCHTPSTKNFEKQTFQLMRSLLLRHKFSLYVLGILPNQFRRLLRSEMGDCEAVPLRPLKKVILGRVQDLEIPKAIGCTTLQVMLIGN